MSISHAARLTIASVAAAFLSSTPRPPESRIAFASLQDGNWEIYVMDADGSHQTRLTTGGDQDRFPLWSPDGSKLAFGSQVNGNSWELWLMNADGSNPRSLVAKITAKGLRQWSPDGTHIALAAIMNGDLEIVTVGLDGRAPVNLTHSQGDDRDPSWSADGQRIVFSSTRSGASAIYSMRVDGSDVRRLTPEALPSETPVSSPDGRQIAFLAHPDSLGDIYVMNADGSAMRRLTMRAGATRDAVRWSPDGLQLAVQIARGTNYDLDVVRVADARTSHFASSSAYDGMASWARDGRHIAFVSARDSADRAYIADADGRNVRRLTDTPALNPVFTP